MAIETQLAADLLVRERLHPARAEDNARHKERHRCPKCHKEFGHFQILHLHLRLHESGENSFTNASPKRDQPKTQEEEDNNCCDGKDLVQQQQHEPSKLSTANFQPKKLPGLTKIRLEDCLRCDECSCIYMDKNDYVKHMKNFHNSSPKKQKQKKGCRSCCRHCNCRNRHEPQKRVKAVDKGNNNLFHYNIKDRWSKILAQTISANEAPPLKIKEEKECDPDEPDEMTDYSHLLSQVEVKIKTEPPDEQDCT